MFKDLLKGILSAIVIKVLDNYRHLSIQLLRIEEAKAYLRGVQMARRAAIGLMGMGLLIGLIFGGLVLLHAGVFILLPWTLETKAIVGIFLGLVYVIGGVLALRAALDERTWMNQSGATKMINEAIRFCPKD